jgi:hypothetical protein
MADQIGHLGALWQKYMSKQKEVPLSIFNKHNEEKKKKPSKISRKRLKAGQITSQNMKRPCLDCGKTSRE